MVDLTPNVNTNVSQKPTTALEVDEKIIPEAPKGSIVDKLKMNLPIFPMAMSSADGYGASTRFIAMFGKGVGGNLSENVSASASVQGIYNITNIVNEPSKDTVIEDPLQNRPIVDNMSFSGLGVNERLNYKVIGSRPSSQIDNTLHPSLDVSASGNMDFLINRGSFRLNSSLFEGNRYGGVRLSAYKGQNIGKGDSGYALTPTQGWSVDGSLQKEVGGGKTLIAMAGVSQDEMTMPKVTQPGAIDYGNNTISSRMYRGNIMLVRKTDAFSASATAMDDNQGYKIRTLGLGYQTGTTSVRADLVCRASEGESLKCNNLGVNVSHAW